ncbi:DUF202 domain-containing protein [Mycobacterium shigaense]|uniref:Uncharacterized protein n=1 Tax=Mycobacterium shigaense TaxID=722731 RepID=A0A1Z4EK49_9MYCO|nr:DUF202 domain-containing protein [Mycobacterium shigaense]PRI15653.1 hypothetical protein B2J96_09755 [Mycobacterium shigaense]BAX93334.1 hypothetical protein MSG_03196 [Mycobacterium shigaense]
MTRPQADPRAATLPAERTVLAWTRTSFAFLVNGVLLTLKDLRGVTTMAALLLAGVAGAAAVTTYAIAIRRQRILQQRPMPPDITPRRQVYLIGITTLLLIAMTMIAQLSR